jgi:lysophospholipase L1-like esterase
MLLFGLGLGLLCAEVVVKVIDVKTAAARRVATQRISRMSDDPVIRFELIPNVEAQTPGQTTTVRVNNLGFRGKDISPEKPAGTFRIAVIGDSIAFGRPYADEAIFPALLEDMLNEAMPERRFEVVNAALSGRDTWEEAAVLERQVLPLDPDVVILQICLNDHVRLPKPVNNRQVGMFGERPWYRYSSLLRLLDTRLPGFRAHHVAWMTRLGLDTRTPEEVLRDQSVAVDQLLEVEANWDAWSRELLRIAELTRAHGAEILFVVFPIDYEILRGDTQTLPVLTELAAEHGIPLMDMLPFFQDRPKGMLRDYTHPTAKGHYVTARELAVVIRKYLQAQP